MLGDIRFQEIDVYPTGGGSTGAFVADFDGDTDLDYAIANRNGDSVSVYYNDGFGVFENHQDFLTGNNPRYVEGHDFDGDGDVDLCTPDYYGMTTTLLENDGNGNFSISQQFEMFTPAFVWIDDLDLDGNKDLITLEWDDEVEGEPHQSPGKVTPLYSNGDGTFELGASAYIGVQPRGADSGDLNGDGLIDVVVADIYSRTISIVLAKGVRTWQESVQISMFPGTPRYISLGDFDEDGDLDIAALDKLGDIFWILANDGQANFTLVEEVHVNDAPHSMEIIDVEGDGDLDFVVSHVGSIVQLILYNDGLGQIESMQGLIIPGGAAEIKLADFNLDGMFDILTANIDNSHPGSSVLLQQECLTCDGGEPCPPSVNDIVIFTDSFTTIDIQLEGETSSNNQLQYFLTSLPSSGALKDSKGDDIDFVPYYLPTDTLQYIPVNGFVGVVTFDYFANDCLLSNQGLTKLYVDPVYPDECDESLEVFNGVTDIYNVNATASEDLYDLTDCDGTQTTEMYHDIWLHYFACENGTLTIDTCDLLDFDSTIVVYDGTCCYLNQIACHSGIESCGGNSQLTVDGIEAGQFYFIRIGSSTASSTGGGSVIIDGPSVGCVESCFTDLNSDGIVNVEDLLFVLSDWGQDCGPADLNLDEVVDVVDLLAIIGDWGVCNE
ncbi:MAG: VCBS repeat-containing protein [Phycisphaerae bacterium]|nr:VCBS repeat-containing protein [Phycisphaerae bacterium]